MPETSEQIARQSNDQQPAARGWVVQNFKQFNAYFASDCFQKWPSISGLFRGATWYRLHRAMELTRRKNLPQGLLGQAIDYTLKRWTALNQFITDGILEIDNNKIENAIRPSAFGKLNWMFIGHPEAGERSAVIYTLPSSCQRHGINPFDYLKDLFTRLPAAKTTEIHQFTPAG